MDPIKFVFNKRFEYNVEVVPAKVAIWEAYKPFADKSGLFSLYRPEQFVTTGTLSRALRFETLYNNLDKTISNYFFSRTQENTDDPFRAVECGSGEFITTRMIATVMERSIRSEKTFHVYDTFKGLPGSDYQPELDDLKGLFIGTLEQFRNKIGSFRFTEARPGFVPKSLPNDDINIYDFVHLDMDLYEGTLGAMEHFFPRLRKGGIIHIERKTNETFA